MCGVEVRCVSSYGSEGREGGGGKGRLARGGRVNEAVLSMLPVCIACYLVITSSVNRCYVIISKLYESGDILFSTFLFPMLDIYFVIYIFAV